MWAGIDPYIVINDVDRPLFAFWKVPFANHIESDSPLGVSVYSRAVKLLNEADLQWDRYLWEFEGGELAVDAGEEVLRQRPGENHLKQHLLVTGFLGKSTLTLTQIVISRFMKFLIQICVMKTTQEVLMKF